VHALAYSISIASFPTQKFLQAQSKANALAWIGFGVLIAHVLLLWLFIIEFRWGTAGAVLAFDITSWGIALAEKIIRQTIFFPCQN
jgi:MATE family multidrug resistance protein